MNNALAKLEQLHAQIAAQQAKAQAGMRHAVKASLLVTTGLQPVPIAAQTLIH
jgi:hypothetical protein